MAAQESNPDEAGLTPEQLEERVREKAALKESKAKIAADKLAAKEAKKKLRCARSPFPRPCLHASIMRTACPCGTRRPSRSCAVRALPTTAHMQFQIHCMPFTSPEMQLRAAQCGAVLISVMPWLPGCCGRVWSGIVPG